MMVNKNIETIKQHIFINGKMVHYALNTAWYEKNNIYIIDFVDFQNKILYEIKPDSEKLNEKNLAKFEAAKNWAKNNGYIFEIITEKWFQDNLKNYIFSEENKHLNLKLKGLISKKCKK